jgi:hypothetical protein
MAYRTDADGRLLIIGASGLFLCCRSRYFSQKYEEIDV